MWYELFGWVGCGYLGYRFVCNWVMCFRIIVGMLLIRLSILKCRVVVLFLGIWFDVMLKVFGVGFWIYIFLILLSEMLRFVVSCWIIDF